MNFKELIMSLDFLEKFVTSDLKKIKKIKKEMVMVLWI
jgi:hypothetical protein